VAPTPERGRHKVFLGMAAGVGKTYAMLEEGHEWLADGDDVLVGLLETHGRAATAERARGLELLPRRAVEHRGTVLEEMDLPGILHRRPVLCLIDELAHTNAPGVEHAKRYEDVEDVLGAGIHVVSTMNVQHLESLNDLVTELTGVRVRETVPDAVLARADDVVLVDLTPEELLERLRAGRVYPQERIDAALNGFFTVENLVALREVALRQVAEAVGAQRISRVEVGTRGGQASREASPAVAERLLALVRPRPADQRIVRRAWRSAQRLGAPLDVLWVRSHHDLDAQGEASLRALRRLCSLLGCELHVIEGDDVVQVVREFCAERGTTYLLTGRPHDSRLVERLREPLPVRLVRALDGVDVRIVADRVWRGPQEDEP
jgi:two-component system sensor histidine kinase KdpD